MTQHIKVFEQVASSAFCQDVMAKFDNDKRVKPDPQPDYSKRHYLNSSQCMDWLRINTEFCRLTNALCAQYFKRPKALAHGAYHEWSDDGYVVSRYAVGDTCILHIDGQTAAAPNNGLRIATLVLYLNDVEVGGETFFPLQDLKVQPRVGRAVMFPVGFTHPHEVLAAKNSRYIMQTWVTDPHFLVVRRPEG